MHVQTQREIQALLKRHSVRPRKRHGQNFLIDGNLMRRLVRAAELTPQDVVLEVGGGTGGLTDLLLADAQRVLVVEIDPFMQSILAERFAGRAHFEMIRGDALAGKHRLAEPLASALAALPPEQARRLKLVANLPYNIATPLLVNLLLSSPAPVRYVFTVQQEMADRLTAVPGTKAYGPLSALWQVAAEIRSLVVLPPGAFWPRPQVTSSMIAITPRPRPPAGVSNLARFAWHLHAGFAYRRKTLRFNLRKAFGEEITKGIGETFDVGRRAETLSVEEWTALSGRLAELTGERADDAPRLGA